MGWSGSGPWVALCNLIGGAAGAAAAFFSHQPDNIAGAIFFVVWGVVSGILIFFLTRAVMSKAPRRLRNVATGETHEIAPGGTFDGLPMGWWAVINPIVCAIMAVVVYLGYFNPMTYLRLE